MKPCLLIVVVAFLTGCNLGSSNLFNINLNGLRSKQDVRLVLYEFQLKANTTREWVALDTMKLTSKDIATTVSWPKKYNQSFVSQMKVFDNANRIVAMSDEFILSNDNITLQKDIRKKPITLKHEYLNAITLQAEGGENKLFNDKRFLAEPTMQLPPGFRYKLKNYNSVQSSSNPKIKQFIKYENKILSDVQANCKSYCTIYRLMSIYGMISNQTLEKCLNALDEGLKHTGEWGFLKMNLDNSKHLVIGAQLPQFKIIDINGRQLSFQSVRKSKYYFLDFWASWCGPCRYQLQDLKKLYSRIDTNKLQFVSLSIDAKGPNWLKAMEDEKIKWPSYNQLNNTDHNLNINSIFCLWFIPQNIVIDDNGIIVSKNTDVDELERFFTQRKMWRN